MQIIPIPLKDIKCLRGHLDAIEEILQKHGQNSGSIKGPDVVPKESKAQKVNKYKTLIGSGARGKKPNHLKNQR